MARPERADKKLIREGQLLAWRDLAKINLLQDTPYMVQACVIVNDQIWGVRIRDSRCTAIGKGQIEVHVAFVSRLERDQDAIEDYPGRFDILGGAVRCCCIFAHDLNFFSPRGFTL